MRLLTPTIDCLDSYADALERGWSPDNLRPAAAADEMAEIRDDPAAFIGRISGKIVNREPVVLPDGSTVPRLPGFRRWLWDGAFCGSIGFRWQPGTPELPAHVLGHVGYGVVPWKRQRGYATRALALLLPEIAALGLPWIELTTDLDNLPSQKVITANGGVSIGRFRKGEAHGGTDSMRFRITLAPAN